MDNKPYLFIVSVSSTMVAPPYFVRHDPTLGKTPDAIDPIAPAPPEKFDYQQLTTEDLQYLAIGSNYVQMKNTYVRLICSLMMLDTKSIIYMVDGYHPNTMKAFLREYLNIIQGINGLRDPYPEVIREVKGTNKEDSSITNWVDQVDLALRKAHQKKDSVPAILYGHVESFSDMIKRMDNATAWGEKKGYNVKNFHTHKFEQLFPFVENYVRAVETRKTEMLMNRAPGLTPTIPPSMPTLGEA